ncbi:hypothetical protein [Glycomyces sp. YM15]|uniref:hypothetical protein n=1 Tax=Glycomyces sp. YM15 TaxID=2800446 RepID=UPI0019664EFC|nr:hypothetical protein [Glycomyces sp. YM15]
MALYEPIDFSRLENSYLDIFDKLNQLHPDLLYIYQQEKGIERWPDYEPYIQLSIEDGLNASHYQADRNSVYGNYVRHPDILPYMVPKDSTAADERAIEEASQADAATAIDEISAAFAEVLDDGQLGPIDALLSGLSGVHEIIDDLITTHEGDGFRRIRELFETWEGSDSEAGMEKFGARLRPAAGFHREILAALIAGAAAECAAQLTAQIQLGQVLDTVLDNVEVLKNGKDFGLMVLVRTGYSKVPFASEITAVVDAVYAFATGADDRPASTWTDQFFALLEMEYELSLKSQDATRMRQEMLNAAAEAKLGLQEARDKAKAILDIDLGTWQSFYDTDRGVLVPGESD